ncbi:uncharacterized protein PV09_02844 [Verruconis gallopava]|uniref:EXPERA domain-containing protein n=1 Tax=Verruconis gallopava TaxID=253628 RepID=A0A0D1XUG3_9PEZI|nr:uncharacterized protein PV09_02844 [Verruconis gallopava]KIW06391.1 hypothetical protein PV09_02844 [Verruconis gallopava]
MVSTRNHPKNFPPPDLSPTKASPSKRAARSSTAVTEDAPADGSVVSSPRPRARSIATTWSHAPTGLTQLWLLVSVPLVVWDTGYMLGRPHTMPGGRLHWPLYVPYALYGTVDYVYGFPHLDRREGFGPAQALCNAVETVMYLVYAYLAFRYGRSETAVPGSGLSLASLGFAPRKIVGREAGLAALLGFAAAVMTFWKTVLYWLIEFYNGFQNIGHNPIDRLILLWIIPNGAWLVGAGYMMYACGSDILRGLEMAAGLPHKKEV